MGQFDPLNCNIDNRVMSDQNKSQICTTFGPLGASAQILELLTLFHPLTSTRLKMTFDRNQFA